MTKISEHGIGGMGVLGKTAMLDHMRKVAGLTEAEDLKHLQTEKQIFSDAKGCLDAVCSLAEKQMKELSKDDPRMADYKKMYGDAMNLKELFKKHLSKY